MGIDIVGWLNTLPPELIYIAVFVVVGVGSIGVPSPIQTVVAGASFLASQSGGANPWIIWLLGASGAVIGGLIGYNVGLSHGYKFLNGLERLYPKHINTRSIRFAEKMFHRHGFKTIFLGRSFTGFFRIFAGPIAGVLKMKRREFYLANLTSGVFWCGMTVWAVYFFGLIANQWLDRLSWVAFIAAFVIGMIISAMFQKRFIEYMEKEEEAE